VKIPPHLNKSLHYSVSSF